MATRQHDSMTARQHGSMALQRSLRLLMAPQSEYFLFSLLLISFPGTDGQGRVAGVRSKHLHMIPTRSRHDLSIPLSRRWSLGIFGMAGGSQAQAWIVASV